MFYEDEQVLVRYENREAVLEQSFTVDRPPAGEGRLVLAMHVDGLAGFPSTGGLDRGREIGIAVFRTYIVPFELLSVLLLAAIFGALMIARKEKDA